MTKKADVSKGDDVAYKWGKGTVEGEVTKVHMDDVEKTIKGNHGKAQGLGGGASRRGEDGQGRQGFEVDVRGQDQVGWLFQPRS